ncbi:MAG TPA: Xaa-Pro peptidase family protein [Anaeromyxobacteraceae bacterium]|nr:Xaa-Pro peptidase family protein [Anaeromyxobacteraceae bacterium]
MEAAEHGSRLSAFRDALGAGGIDGALVLAAVDLYYLAGTRQSGALWVPTRGDPVLFVRRSLSRARSESAVADVRPFPPSRELAAATGARGRVGTTLDVVPAATLDWWRRQLPVAEWVDVSGALRAQRSVKSPAELAVMREGGRRLSAVLGEVPSFLRPGMREIDLSAEIEARLRRAGNEGSPRLRTFNAELFVGLAVAGAGAAVPGFFDGPVAGAGLHPAYPLGASERPIGRDEPVMVDFTAVFGGYVVDMTRMAVCGALAPDLARTLEVARAIQAEVSAGLRPGAVPEELWGRAVAMAGQAGLGDVFMGPPGEQARFVGHGVGLELDELPVIAPGSRVPLRAGQTVAVEPKFVFPGRGAVGIENTWVVTEAGGERLTGLADGLMGV